MKRKKAEDRLRRSEAYLAEAQRLSHTGVCGLQRDRQFSIGRRRLTASGGLIRRRVFRAAKQCSNGSIRTTETGCAKRLERSRAREEITRVEYRIVLPDGTVKHPRSDRLTCVLRERGACRGCRGHNIDVTERKRAEQALRESEAKIRRLVDANIIGIFIWDLDGRIIEANDAFLRMVGYDR